MARYKRSIHMGDWKVRDDVYGLTYLASETTKTWDNLIVPKDYFDVKHPQLEIKARRDRIAVPEARPTSESDSDLPFGEGNPNDL